MRAPEILTKEAWRGYQCDTFPEGSWVSEGDMLRVSEALPHAWQSGLEMQLLDDARHPDGQIPETSAGALYGLIAPRRKVLRPLGSFNTARILVHDTARWPDKLYARRRRFSGIAIGRVA